MALIDAAICGNLGLVKRLLDDGANIHDGYDLPLRWACSKGHLGVVKELLDRGANIHADNDDALCCCIYEGHLEVASMLLKRGADTRFINIGNIHSDNIRHLLMAYPMRKKYWNKWRRFLMGRWARRLLQVWFRPDMPGGLRDKKSIAQF